MKTKYFLYGMLLVLCIPFFSQCNLLYADDGYDLWMKYKKTEDANRLAEYQQSITSVIVEGRTETCRIIIKTNKLLYTDTPQEISLIK